MVTPPPRDLIDRGSGSPLLGVGNYSAAERSILGDGAGEFAGGIWQSAFIVGLQPPGDLP